MLRLSQNQLLNSQIKEQRFQSIMAQKFTKTCDSLVSDLPGPDQKPRQKSVRRWLFVEH